MRIAILSGLSLSRCESLRANLRSLAYLAALARPEHTASDAELESVYGHSWLRRGLRYNESYWKLIRNTLSLNRQSAR